MEAMWKYLGETPEVFAALIGAVLGSLAGAWIQARGGYAQARAAQKSAEINAEAQRVAALWTVRQVQIAQLVRSASSLRQACNRLWVFNEEGLIDQIGTTSEELTLLWAEARLIATENVVAAAGQLAAKAIEYEELTLEFAPALHAKKKLDRYVPDSGSEQALAVERIMAGREGDPEVRAEELYAVLQGALSVEEVYHLVANGHIPVEELEDLRDQGPRECLLAENALVHEARAMLRSKEDAQPAVPQRLRWLRRNSAATPTGSA